MKGLTDSASGQTGVAEAAAALAVGLARIQIKGASFGDVPAVAEFVRVALSVREAQANGAAGEAERRRDVAGRLRSAAELGERLIVDSTKVAQSVVPLGDGAEILRAGN